MNSLREAVKPVDKKFSLVEVSLGEPVEDAATKIAEYDNLNDISVPDDTPYEFYVVYDRQGNVVA